MPEKNWSHEPVMKKEICAFLLFSEVKTVFDGTLGLGGHAQIILETFPNIKQYVACDLDRDHLIFAQKRLGTWKEKLSVHRANFAQIKEILSAEPREHPLVILLDLGLCSTHVDDPEKGFSFSQESPLHLCFAREGGITAEQFLQKSSEKELTRIFRQYGELPHAPKIARALVEARQEKPFKTTQELRTCIEEVTHPKDRKKAVTLVFQALRMAVNDELGVLERALQGALETMQSGDRMGVITYHSLEDRLVKNVFGMQSKPITRETAYSLHEEIAPASFRLLQKKPYVPSAEEVAQNPRARSAKLRILECIV